MISASALKRFCAYPSVLDKVPPRTAAERAREANKKASAESGTRGHKLFEQWCLGQVSHADDQELQGYLDGLAYQWRPPSTFEAELAWGLTMDGNYAEVVEVEPHIYRAVDGSQLLTAGRADGCWTSEVTIVPMPSAAGRMAQGKPRVPSVAAHEGSLLQPKGAAVAPVRGAGNHGLPEVAGLVRLPGGHGSQAIPRGDAGTEGQRRQLRAGELSLGQSEGAGQESTHHQAGDLRWQGDVAGGGLREDRGQLWDSSPQGRSRLADGGGLRPAAQVLEPKTTACFVVDFKFGKWPVDPAGTNLQVNAAGMALALRAFATSYVPAVYYARDMWFDWGEPVEVASKEWRAMFEEIRVAALLDEKPHPGPHCGRCWSRSKCPASEAP